MDPVTLMLAGIAIADSLPFTGTLGRPAVVSAAILAALPDIDLLPAFISAFPANPFTAALFDPHLARMFHRGYTHAAPVLVAAGLVAECGLFRCCKIGRLGWWLALAWASLFSHAILDMTNGAVCLFLPFSRRWYGLPLAAEGSPLLLLPLLEAVS